MSEFAKLKDLCLKIGSGATPRGGNNVYLDKGNYTLIRSQNVYNEGFSEHGIVYISDSDAKKLDNVSVEENDVLINITGDSVARVTLPDNRYLPARVNQHVAILRANPEKLDFQFLKYSLIEKSMQEYLLTLASSGATRNALTKGMLENIEIKLPSLDEQKRVSGLLSKFDQKIQLNIQINQTLEQIAQALFKSWFVDFDPVRAKVQALSDGLSLEQSELAAMQAISGKTPEELTALSQTQPDRYVELAETAKAFPCEMVEVDGVEVPKGWELKPFGSLLENTIGGDWGKEEEDEKHTENVFVFRGTDLPNVQINEFDVIPKRYIAKNKLKSRKAKYGDIIIEVSGGSKNQPTGRSLLITKNLLCNFNLPIIPASFCRLFTPINEKIAVLLACHLKMIYTQGKTWEYQVQSTGISNFQTKNFLENELVVIPDENIFNAFYEKVGVIFEKMTSNENMLLSKTRDLLLPRLLNGKI
ncbi:TPA: restriction endonuclease subunit S [Haemophilus influenzae]